MADKQLNIIVKAKDEASSTLQSLSSSIKDNFGKISVAAGVAGAAILGFSTVALKGFADTGEEIYNFSQASGLAADSASALKLAADGMGLSLDSVGGAVKKMQINLASMADDTKKADAALKPLGMSFNDIKSLKPDEQFIKLGNSIASIKDPAQRTAAAVSVFGKSGADLIPLFNNGTASMDEFKKSAADAGVLFDDLAMNKANALDNALDSLNATMAGVSQQLATALAPAATALIQQLTPLIQTVTDWMAKNPELTAQIIGISAAVLGLLAILPGLVAIFTALGTVLAFIAANPIVLIIAAIVAFGAWLVWLYNTNETFRAGVNAVWEAIKTAVGTAIQFISDTIGAIVTDLKAKWDEDWGGVRSKFEEVWTFLSTTGVEYVTTLITKIKEAVTPIVQFFQDNWDEISAIWNINIAALQFVWDTFWAAVKLTFTIAWDFLKMTIKLGLALMKGDWEGAWNAIKTFFIETWNAIKQFAKDVIDNISKMLGEWGKGLETLFKDWSKTISDTWSGMWNGLQSVAKSVTDFINGIVDAMVRGINSAISSLQSLLGMKGGSSSPRGGGGGSFATGGMPNPNTANVVGENGPELFIPNQRGTVIPSSKSNIGGGGITIIVSGNTVLSDDGAEQIGDMIMNKLRLQTKI